MTDDELQRLLEGHTAESRRYLDEAVNRLTAENRQALETTAEGLRDQIRLVAEGVSDAKELTRREIAEIREEMRRGFAETQAMIKF